MKPRELIKILEENGWQWVATSGSPRHFKHPDKPNKLTVPYHNKDLKAGTLNGILKDAGLK